MDNKAETKAIRLTSEALPTDALSGPNTGLDRANNSIFAAAAKLALRCALASLALCTRRRQSQAKEEIRRTEALTDARMAYATINQQAECLCTSCRCELLVTAFRDDFVFSKDPEGAECSDKAREFYAVCEPFTSTEIELLDTNDEEHIRRIYPALAGRVQKEIEARYLNGSHRDGCVRGMLCTDATRH
jgi:hypothetical protein